MGSAPSVLSMVRVTSARPSGGRDAVPAKTTSSILPPRRLLAPCSPITQAKASTILDLPDPFGPTTQVIPGSNRSDVAEAKDLNPRRVRLFTYTRGLSLPVWSLPRPAFVMARWPARTAGDPAGQLPPHPTATSAFYPRFTRLRALVPRPRGATAPPRIPGLCCGLSRLQPEQTRLPSTLSKS